MKIVYIAGCVIPSNVASSIHVMKMCQGIAKNGHEVTLIATNYNPVKIEDHIYDFYGVENCFNIFLLKRLKIRGKYIFSLYQLYRLLKKFDSNDTLVYGREVYGLYLSQLLGFKVMYESHLLPGNKLIYFLEKRLFQASRFKKLIFISNALKELYHQIYGNIKNIEVHHDAADENNINGTEDYKWPSSRTTLQIGYVGHLYKGRGIDIIIECARQCPEYDFHIVGGDKKDVRAWAKSQVGNTYFHGFVPPKLTTLIRNRCDLLLMPYQRVLATTGGTNTSQWMSPMKMFEYMSSRKAIISSDLPVIREVLNENNSILVTPDNADEWVKAIRLLENEELREKLADHAYIDFKNKYNWTKRAWNILQDYA